MHDNVYYVNSNPGRHMSEMRRSAGACPSLASRCRPLLLSFQQFASFDGVLGRSILGGLLDLCRPARLSSQTRQSPTLMHECLCNVRPQEINCLTDLRHPTKIDAIAQALRAMGKRLEMSVT